MILFLRHGEAEQGDGDDAARRLTAEGERQSDTAGRALSALGVRIDACLASPKVRGRDTARLACRHLGVEVEGVDALRGGDFDPLELSAGRGDVLLVGHEPDFSRAVKRITGGVVKLRKGGIAAVQDGELHLLLRPREIELVARDRATAERTAIPR